MKLYDGGRAPNPRRVRVFLAEKGIDVPTVPVDMGAGEHRSEAIARLNPLRRLPILELDDGTILTETMAICRYVEELHPEPALFGVGALERAQVEMWQRRVELELLLPVTHAFRHLHPAMADWEAPRIAEWGEANKAKAVRFLQLLDRQLADRPFIVGERFTVADITGMISIDFMKPAKIELPEDLVHVARWYREVSSRPGARA